MTNSLPPRGRRRCLWGGLPQGRGGPSHRGGADCFRYRLERQQVHGGRNAVFPPRLPAPAKRVLRQPGKRVLLLGAVTVPGPRLALGLAPSAGRGARGDPGGARGALLGPCDVATLARHDRHGGHGHGARHAESERAHQHLVEEGITRPAAIARPHLGRDYSSWTLVLSVKARLVECPNRSTGGFSLERIYPDPAAVSTDTVTVVPLFIS